MKVVATLTTRNKYHKNLSKTLNSLTSQFDVVYLGLPYKNIKGEDYPKFEHPGVEIVRLDEDIGSASKLLGALLREARDPNTLIVSVDDDHTYNPNLRKLFEEERKKDIEKGLTRVLTQAGVYIKYWNFGIYGLNGVGHDRDYTFDYNSNPELTTIAGVCGVAYPANIFLETEDYINFIKKYFDDKVLFRNDDVLISAYISKLGIKKVKISKTLKDFGVENKEEGNEKISPNLEEVFGACKKLENLFIKENKFKVFSLTFFDIIITFLIILVIILTRLKSKTN